MDRVGRLRDDADSGGDEVRDGHQFAVDVALCCLLDILLSTMKRAAQKTMDSFFKVSNAGSKQVKVGGRRDQRVCRL